MAAFSFQHHPFSVDSVFLQSPTLKPPAIFQQDQDMNISSSFPYHPIPSSSPTLQEPQAFSQASVMEKQKTDSSSMTVERQPAADKRPQNQTTQMVKNRKRRDGPSMNPPQPKKKCGGGGGDVKENKEKKAKASKKNEKAATEEAPKGYIHVRARRGQATDSHSLAERVRREKISERMKMLQGLVPGCDKVTGKAMMLDEIINYVQSLQNQVEFLSMKLASVNPIFYGFSTDLDDYESKSEKLKSIASPLPSLELSNHNPGAAFATDHAATATTATSTTATTPFPVHNYDLLDTSVAVLLNGQRSNSFSQLVRGHSHDLLTAALEKERDTQWRKGGAPLKKKTIAVNMREAEEMRTDGDQPNKDKISWKSLSLWCC
ncbi:hypothetical protein ACLOJK_019215 [Asimina triloba]